MHPAAKRYIRQLKLESHPEGGYFREIYRSGEIILPEGLPERFRKGRAVSTSIYFLLEGNQFSKFHRIKSDEIWHFYDGCGVKIYVIDSSGIISERKLGKDIEKGEELQIVIKNNQWFAAELIDKSSFCLVGCTVSPGFDFEDFEIGDREELVRKYPEYGVLIERFT
ncbi:MAG TPA: cupin domain-containing protein [Ignavibacteriaceae bacterium]|nr:cupin domain-containing protein [Ignavibacteriaceae bacterium]